MDGIELSVHAKQSFVVNLSVEMALRVVEEMEQLTPEEKDLAYERYAECFMSEDGYLSWPVDPAGFLRCILIAELKKGLFFCHTIDRRKVIWLALRKVGFSNSQTLEPIDGGLSALVEVAKRRGSATKGNLVREFREMMKTNYQMTDAEN